jgi:hypothetical protein
VGFSERLGASSLGEGRPHCWALGRLKYGLRGNAIIQIAIASPASSDMTSIILSYLTFVSPRISRRFNDNAIPIWISNVGIASDPIATPAFPMKRRRDVVAEPDRVEFPRGAFLWMRMASR